MILSEVRDYLQQRGRATLADIALHFDTEPDAVRGMLQIWIQKGKVHRQMATASGVEHLEKVMKMCAIVSNRLQMVAISWQARRTMKVAGY